MWKKWLNYFKRKHIPVKNNNDCLFAAILEQVGHSATFTANTIRCMVAFHFARMWDLFEPVMHCFLTSKRQSYFSYIWNVYHGYIFGDEYVAMAIAHMWNVKITIMSAERKQGTTMIGILILLWYTTTEYKMKHAMLLQVC